MDARNLATDFVVADVWTGRGELELYDCEFEKLTPLGPVDVIGGFGCSVVFTIVGAEVRKS